MHMAQVESAILVAEDNEDIRELVAHQLRRMGIHVLQAENGRKAMELALAEQPALVLMDMDMPVMSGFDAVAQLRQRGYTKSIYALTGHSEGPEAERAMASGCDGLLGKPICSDVLRAQVQKVLAEIAAGEHA
jgi:CheY-like chemotaxis protein